ncbi:MAG: ABC transporter substrate-binding protein [Candidatus Paceibacterota bacterium]|jgi:NitT/TauT family transport system substrate-binding protein
MKKTIFTNKYVWLLLLGTLLLLPVLIMSINNSKKASPSQLLKVRIGYIPILDCSQIYVAKQQNYFSQNELDVELVPLSSGPAIIQALSSGAIDIGFANLATIVFYEQTSPRLNRLSGGTRMDKYYSEAGLVVLTDSGIEKIADLKGKTIAVNSRRNIVDLAVLKAIKSARLSANDITLVEIPFKDMETAIRAKRIDAATLPEPFLSVALKGSGLRNLGDHFAIAFGELYSTGYYALPNSRIITPEVIRKYDLAIAKATSDLNNPTDKTYEAISAVTKLPPDILKSSGKPEYVINVPEIAYEKMKTWLKEEKLLGN